MQTAADVLRKQPGLLGDASKPGLQALSRLVTDAEAALQVWLELVEHTQVSSSMILRNSIKAVPCSCTRRRLGICSWRSHAWKPTLQRPAGEQLLADGRPSTLCNPSNQPATCARPCRRQDVKAGTVADQFVIRAHFAAGQLVSKLSSSFKGRQLVDAVLEAVGSIMRGVELAAANPRCVSALPCCSQSSSQESSRRKLSHKHAQLRASSQLRSSQFQQFRLLASHIVLCSDKACCAVSCRYSHLVYNGSVHFWHVARPLQCDKLRSHLLPSQEKLCQVGLILVHAHSCCEQEIAASDQELVAATPLPPA
jgi:hypothetical protein